MSRPLDPAASARFATVFAAALGGDPCTVVGLGEAHHLPVSTWLRDANASDRVLLSHCIGPTLDIGCGPGRMSAHLARQGRVVLGIDLVAEAVARTRDRGAAALLRDVFGPVPGEGRWGSALLADGNVGIGGDPVTLLSRVAVLLAPYGRVVVDVAPPGVGVERRTVRIQNAEGRTRPFPWAVVGADAIAGLARAAGLAVLGLHIYDRRWFAVLVKEPSC